MIVKVIQGRAGGHSCGPVPNGWNRPKPSNWRAESQRSRLGADDICLSPTGTYAAGEGTSSDHPSSKSHNWYPAPPFKGPGRITIRPLVLHTPTAGLDGSLTP